MIGQGDEVRTPDGEEGRVSHVYPGFFYEGRWVRAEATVYIEGKGRRRFAVTELALVKSKQRSKG